MNKQLVSQINASQLRNDLPSFSSGDTIKVMVQIVENDKKRLQAFEGDVIAVRGAGINKTFTIRKRSGGIGVERVFFLHSPVLETIEVVKRGKVRRNKIYYLRERSGKSARIKDQN